MKSKPTVEDENSPVYVSPFRLKKFGISPHVVLTVGRSGMARTVKLAPKAARRIAIALLASAEEIED